MVLNATLNAIYKEKVYEIKSAGGFDIEFQMHNAINKLQIYDVVKVLQCYIHAWDFTLCPDCKGYLNTLYNLSHGNSFAQHYTYFRLKAIK